MTDPYRVIVERWGTWWTIEVPDVPGCHSQAPRLDQVEATARELIAFQLGLLDSKMPEIELTLEVHLPAEPAGELLGALPDQGVEPAGIVADLDAERGTR